MGEVTLFNQRVPLPTWFGRKALWLRDAAGMEYAASQEAKEALSEVERADEACPAPAIVERMAAEQDARLGAGMTERAKFRMNKP